MATTQTSKNSKSKAAGGSGKKSASSKKETGAIALLKQDHRDVEKMFEQFEKARSADRKAELALKICKALTVHAQIEEELFYPEARGEVDEDLLDEAEVEHSGAKKLIAEIEAMTPDDRLFDAKVTVLSEYIKHHVKEEEEELFPEAKKSDMDLDAIGEQLAARKQELMAELDGD